MKSKLPERGCRFLTQEGKFNESGEEEGKKKKKKEEEKEEEGGGHVLLRTVSHEGAI